MVVVEVEPGAAHGDDAAGIEDLAAGVAFAGVVLEDDARGALELVDDDALGAVDDERAFFGHERHGAEIDDLFLDVADGAVFRLFIHVVHDQADLDAQGRLEGQALGDALGHVVFRFADFVADVFQRGGAIEVLDGKDRTEDAFKSRVLPAGGRNIFLQKQLVGVDLQIEQMGNGQRFDDLAEIFGQLGHCVLCCRATTLERCTACGTPVIGLAERASRLVCP